MQKLSHNFKILLGLLQSIAFASLVSCNINSKIADLRPGGKSGAGEFFFANAQVKSPCTVIGPASDDADLSLTNNLSVKAIHVEAIAQQKKQLPAEVSIELKSVRNLGKSIYYQYEYLVHGNKVCGQSLRIRFNAAGKSIVVGNFDKNTLISPSYKWESLDLDTIEKSEHISQLGAQKISLISSDNCLKMQDDKLVPVTNLVLLINGLSYLAEVQNNEIIALEDGFMTFAHTAFDNEGSATIYDDNIGQETKTFNLKNLESDSDFLCGKEIITSKSNLDEFTQSATRDYDFPIGSVGFRDTSVFTNAYVTLEWLKNLGWSNWSTQQINIILDQPVGPLYLKTPPTIYLPNQTTSLGNLQVDKDVITHEMAHHYLWDFWGTAGETIILHEGLADFFTIAQSANACVGERICQGSAQNCVAQQCFRNADNTIKYQDKEYSNLSNHRKSQVVSGMLWDAHKRGGINLEQLLVFVHESLPLTSEDATIADFVNALLIPAQEASANQVDTAYHCTLIDSAKAKGLLNLITDDKIISECRSGYFTLNLSASSFADTLPPNFSIDHVESLGFDYKVSCDNGLATSTSALRAGILRFDFDREIADDCALKVAHSTAKGLSISISRYGKIQLTFANLRERMAYQGQLTVSQSTFAIAGGALAKSPGFSMSVAQTFVDKLSLDLSALANKHTIAAFARGRQMFAQAVCRKSIFTSSTFTQIPRGPILLNWNEDTDEMYTGLNSDCRAKIKIIGESSAFASSGSQAIITGDGLLNLAELGKFELDLNLQQLISKEN